MRRQWMVEHRAARDGRWDIGSYDFGEGGGG